MVQARLGDPRVSLVTVPDAAPRTKPKALDYALPLCKGEHVVVYDAEDIPDPDQLWKAALRFREQPDLACQQARLLIDNGHRGWLAALFAAEYAALFSVLLPALARWRLPIPLGGTSNHFRVATLRQIGGWDAFNVTEDADLGMRLARCSAQVHLASRASSFGSSLNCFLDQAPTVFVGIDHCSTAACFLFPSLRSERLGYLRVCGLSEIYRRAE